MVKIKTLNVTLDEETHARAKDVKQQLDLTWPEFIERATEVLEQDPEPEPVPTLREEPRRPFVDQTEGDSDVAAYVRENQPVSRADIIEDCVPEDYAGKPDSWWERHGRDELKEAGAEFTRNVGWTLE